MVLHLEVRLEVAQAEVAHLLLVSSILKPTASGGWTRAAAEYRTDHPSWPHISTPRASHNGSDVEYTFAIRRIASA